jgi:hypothetical protein
MENEMNIVSDESKELANRLEDREMELLEKVRLIPLTCHLREIVSLIPLTNNHRETSSLILYFLHIYLREKGILILVTNNLSEMASLIPL